MPELETKITYDILDNKVVCIKIQGQLTCSEITLFEKTRQSLPKYEKVIVDLSETKDVDSTGFGAFIHLKESADEISAEVVLSNPNSKVNTFIEACHFDKLFTVQLNNPASPGK